MQGEEYQLTTYYLIVTLALLTLACSINLALLLHSARGRIEPSEDQPHPRACVEPLLYANIALTVLEFFWTGLGAYFAIKDFIRCYNEEHERTVIVGQYFLPSRASHRSNGLLCCLKEPTRASTEQRYLIFMA